MQKMGRAQSGIGYSRLPGNCSKPTHAGQEEEGVTRGGRYARLTVGGSVYPI